MSPDELELAMRAYVLGTAVTTIVISIAIFPIFSRSVDNESINHQKSIIVNTLIKYLKHKSTDGTTEKNKLREELKQMVEDHLCYNTKRK